VDSALDWWDDEAALMLDVEGDEEKFTGMEMETVVGSLGIHARAKLVRGRAIRTWPEHSASRTFKHFFFYYNLQFKIHLECCSKRTLHMLQSNPAINTRITWQNNVSLCPLSA
jgi:hypothetical protein